MWVYLETWIIKDGAPELARGDHLRRVGLRADCASLGPARAAADGVAESADLGGARGPGSHRYELTGMARQAVDVRSERGPAVAEFVIAAGDQAFLARTLGLASEVAVGSRVTAQGTLSVVADYEWDAFSLPDVRTDWSVRRLAIEHRQIDHAPGGPGAAPVGLPGRVVRSFEIERMNRWDDDNIPGIMAWYVLDVTPLRAS